MEALSSPCNGNLSYPLITIITAFLWVQCCCCFCLYNAINTDSAPLMFWTLVLVLLQCTIILPWPFILHELFMEGHILLWGHICRCLVLFSMKLQAGTCCIISSSMSYKVLITYLWEEMHIQQLLADQRVLNFLDLSNLQMHFVILAKSDRKGFVVKSSHCPQLLCQVPHCNIASACKIALGFNSYWNNTQWHFNPCS